MVYTVLKIILAMLVLTALVLKIVFMHYEIKTLKRKNAELLRENRYLMQHNGKLFDANQELKQNIMVENTPSFKPW